MNDLPICDCGSVWPDEGHHPECPVRRRIEALEAVITGHKLAESFLKDRIEVLEAEIEQIYQDAAGEDI